MTPEQFEEHLRLGHAIQTGVARELEIDPSSGAPKHLRTGLNMEMCSHAGLVRLLIAKGLFTEAEYGAAVLAELEAEKARYEERLTEHYRRKTGSTAKITLA